MDENIKGIFIKEKIEKIAVVTDTHDNLKKINNLIIQIRKIQPDIIIHCGDFIAPFAAGKFNINIPFYSVYGNNDGEKNGLKKIIKNFGTVKKKFLALFIDNIKIGIIHDFEKLDKSRIKYFDYILCGHTHNFELKTIQKTIILNPGEVCGYLTDVSSFSLINLKTKKIEKIIL